MVIIAGLYDFVGVPTELEAWRLPTKLMDTGSVDLLMEVSCSTAIPQYFPKSPFWKALALNPDLWSLPEQLLLLQPQPFLLDLLQSHLTVACHDCAVLGGQPLLHWGTLGDPLLIQGCKRDKSSNLSQLSNNTLCRDTGVQLKLIYPLSLHCAITGGEAFLNVWKSQSGRWSYAALATGPIRSWQSFMFYYFFAFTTSKPAKFH